MSCNIRNAVGNRRANLPVCSPAGNEWLNICDPAKECSNTISQWGTLYIANPSTVAVGFQNIEVGLSKARRAIQQIKLTGFVG